MKYILAMTLEAEDDLDVATAHYESVSPGGGIRFLERYEKALDRVLAQPRSFPRYKGPSRICLIARSSYGIVFVVGRQSITIIGIICLIRHPRYWSRRLRKYRSGE